MTADCDSKGSVFHSFIFGFLAFRRTLPPSHFPFFPCITEECTMFIPFFFAVLLQLTLFSGPLACSGFSVRTPNFTQARPTLIGRILTNGSHPF